MEYWIGDDADDGSLDDYFAALRALGQQGTETTVMLGNRDFLLGEQFAAKTGVTLIQDDHYWYKRLDAELLLMHGDTLCTDDSDYLAMRRLFRDSDWQQEFLQRSIKDRVSYANDIREKSQDQTALKSSDITDVSQSTVIDTLRSTGARRLVHGHTHRPHRHEHVVDGEPAIRLVVGDWHSNHAVYGVLDQGELRLETYRG